MRADELQVALGSDVPLAVVPAGTGNDAARMLGLTEPMEAVDTVLHGARRRLDVGRVGTRVFLNVLSSGFDSRVNERANAIAEVTLDEVRTAMGMVY